MTMKGSAKRLGGALLLALTIAASTGCATSREASREDGTLAFNQGVISGTAEVCGLDWLTLSFRPMMAYWRRIGMSETATSILAAMHGAGQGQAVEQFSKRDCTDAMRQKVRSQLPFKR